MDAASEVLDLSTDRNKCQQDPQGSENINIAELLKERKEFEEMIHLYNGDDPLELRYNFISWIEGNYPNRGIDNGLISTLEETLSLFKDDQKYAQDTRYVALLIKYIDLQPNALEMYKFVYNQGRGTTCAILYHAWAKQCEKVKDFNLANEIYQLGINNKAQPFEELKQVHLLFQLNMGRRVLGINEEAPNTPSREALKKLQINNQPAKIHQIKDPKSENTSESRLPSKIQASSDKENSSPIPKKSKQEGEQRSAANDRVIQYKGRLKIGKPDTFKCPVAYFEPSDPSKLLMYPKDKVYEIEGKELQLEEIIAMQYETQKRPSRYAKSGVPSASANQAQIEKKEPLRGNLLNTNQDPLHAGDGAFSHSQDLFWADSIPVAYFEPHDPNKIAVYPKEKVYAIKGKEFQLEELKAMQYEQMQNRTVQSHRLSASESSLKTSNLGTPLSQASCEKLLQDCNSNVSLLNNQSMTGATKEVMNIIRGMWNSPSPKLVKKYNAVSSDEKLDSDTFKMPPPPKTGFTLYSDESISSSSQLPGASKKQEHLSKPVKPFIPLGVENMVVPKTGSILKKKLQDRSTDSAPLVCQSREVEDELGVCRFNSDEEEMDIKSYGMSQSAIKQPFVICSDEIDTVETHVNINRQEMGLIKSVTPMKTEFIRASCSTQISATITRTSARKSHFVIPCDDDIMDNQEICAKRDKVNHLVPPLQCGSVVENQYPCITNTDDDDEEEEENKGPLILPYIPAPINDIPASENDGKENADPENINIRRPERRELSGVLQPSINLPVEPLFQDQDKEFDFTNDTCNTRAFAYALPSSTPFTCQLRNFDQNYTAGNDNTSSYCPYMAREEPPKQEIQTNLSIILEASKERYSSSSGSSSSGQTPYGPSRLKIVNTYSEIKGSELCHISEESINDLEKSVANLHLGENIDPFSPDVLTKLLSHIKFPQKYHSGGCLYINHDAPLLRENSTVTLGNEKFVTEKELGKGAYARVLKATHKNKHVALKYQKPAFVWEYYIACEIRKRLSSSPMKNGFIEIEHAYIFSNASILVTEWGKFGSLINVVNAVKIATGLPLKVTVATLFCVQLFEIVEHLHRCKIIHGDIKPDNFILHALPTSDSSQMCIKLIDFGRSIDMSLLPQGTQFTTVVSTDGFQCNEMKEGRPWTYQTDFYGLAGTAYCLLMGDYMKVIKRGGKWGLQTMLPRYLHRDVWQPIFQELLNIESCTSLPDLLLMKGKLDVLLKSMGRLVSDNLNSVVNIIQGH